MTQDQIQALRREFRERFGVTYRIGKGLDQFVTPTVLKNGATPQMIEDWWLTKMGLLNTDI